MARIRTVKPELASDRKLASVSRDARYTFLLLISQADDDGLLRAEPRQILGALYPFDDDVTSEILAAWLAELVQIGAIRWRQTRDGMRVAEITNWSRHQHIKNRSKPFLLNHLDETEQTLTESSVEPTETKVTASVEAGGAESRVLSPESRVSSADFTAGSVSHTNGDNGHGRRKNGRAPPNDSAMFEAAWSVYPKRPNNSRAESWRQWQARVKEGESESVMLSGTEAYAGYVHRERTEARYIRTAQVFYGRGKHYLNDYGTAEPEVQDMTDDFGQMRPHRRDASGQWQQIPEEVRA